MGSRNGMLVRTAGGSSGCCVKLIRALNARYIRARTTAAMANGEAIFEDAELTDGQDQSQNNGEDPKYTIPWVHGPLARPSARDISMSDRSSLSLSPSLPPPLSLRFYLPLPPHSLSLWTARSCFRDPTAQHSTQCSTRFWISQASTSPAKQQHHGHLSSEGSIVTVTRVPMPPGPQGAKRDDSIARPS